MLANIQLAVHIYKCVFRDISFSTIFLHFIFEILYYFLENVVAILNWVNRLWVY